MIKARCLRTCTWNGKYWREGELYQGTETPPEHFAIEETKTVGAAHTRKGTESP